ncbi:hypothetical protein [Streptomyces monomycini]|uniref:hypothetical protein n=1 Tax=Streptomyces monomycini TaxID=371720 RepID=UPI0012FF25A5|nr:hypothetical protein [Streptomyces monomycini]
MATIAALIAVPLMALIAVMWVFRLLMRSWVSLQVSRWIEGAFYSLLATLVVYAWGLFTGFPWDIEEACKLDHQQHWDRNLAGSASYFPLSNKCNSTFDLVPGYVNPLVISGISIVAICIGTAAYQALKRRNQVVKCSTQRHTHDAAC